MPRPDPGPPLQGFERTPLYGQATIHNDDPVAISQRGQAVGNCDRGRRVSGLILEYFFLDTFFAGIIQSAGRFVQIGLCGGAKHALGRCVDAVRRKGSFPLRHCKEICSGQPSDASGGHGKRAMMRRSMYFLKVFLHGGIPFFRKNAPGRAGAEEKLRLNAGRRVQPCRRPGIYRPDRAPPPVRA